MLGGYGKVTDVDVRDSNLFLDFLHDSRPQLGKMCACDCGAGIGRVSKHLLLPRFAHVDLVEQSPRLLASSAEYIGAVDAIRTDCIVAGLQEWIPETGRYDVIWIQWVIGHLWDADFVQFFRRCALALKSGGVIILKDNSAVSWTFVVDRSDRSVARCREYLDTLFSFAGLCIVSESKQTDFPEELYPVYMIALEPIP